MRCLRCLLLVAFVASAPLPAAQQGPFIGTIAGGGPDDVPALQAMLAHPRAVVPAPGGGFFIGTSFNVYRVDPTGHLERVAGNGSGITSGDGGPALEAGLEGVDGMAVDASGNIYISSSRANRVRRIDAATGIITAFAGPGQWGQFGDGRQAIDAYLNYPEGLAVDAAGDLYIADTWNCGVRRVDSKTGVIRSVVGSAYQSCVFGGEGTPALGNGVAASDVAFDPSGNLLVAGYWQVYRVDAATGLMYVAAGTGGYGNTGDGGPARDAEVEAERLAVDAAGNIYLTAISQSRVRRVDAATGIISTFAGDGVDGSNGDGGPAGQARLNRPVGLTFDAYGALLIADDLNHRVRRVEAGGGIITTSAGRYDLGDGLPAIQVPMIPRGIATDAAGNLYVADGLYGRVRRVDAATHLITTVAGNGSRIHSGDGGPATAAGMVPVLLTIDAGGNLFIGDTWNNRVRRVDAISGIITTVAGNGLWGYSHDGIQATQASFESLRAIAADTAGNLYLGDGLIQAPEPPPDEMDNRVRRVDAATGIITRVTRASYGVQSVAVGPAGDIYFGDVGYLPEWSDWQHFGPVGNWIWRVDAATGTRSRIAGNGVFGYGGDGGPALEASMRWPRGIAADGAGNLFFSDSGNNRVRRIDAATGIITTVAGDGIAEFRGDGGPAAAARLSGPEALTIDRDGDLVIADTGNNRVRILSNDCAKLPPMLSVIADPAVLWPPNHRLVEVTISAQPMCALAEVTLASVSSSEPDDAPGGADGSTTGDIQDADPGTADFVVKLRAERSATGHGRAYTATYSATDTLGRTATAVVVVPVPHDQRGVTDPIEISLDESPWGTIVDWTPVEGAFSYDVVRGVLGRVHESGNDIHLGALTCVEAGSTDTTTRGLEDPEVPAAGEVFFYLVQYEDAAGFSSYGEESAAKPRDQSSGGCR